MLERLFLKNVLDDTFKKKIHNNYEDCLRRRSERHKCEKCFSNCPEEAIEIERGYVKIDPILCSGCNLCVKSCYSRALTPVKKPYLKAINYLIDSKTTNWGCIKSKDCDVNFGCLNTIDPRFLFALGFSDLEHNVYLDFSKCEECSYKDTGFNTKEIIEYITIHGKLENLLLINGFNKKEEDEVLTRRDFFKSVFDSTKNYSKETIRETTKSFGFDVDSDEEIDEIIKVLIKHGIKNNRSTEFIKEHIYELNVDDKCTFCYECVSYCPNKALTIENSVDSQNLVVDMNLCTFCNRCIEKCKENAISKKSYIDREKKIIFKKEKTRCKNCKTLTVELNQDGLCSACEIRSKNRKRIKK